MSTKLYAQVNFKGADWNHIKRWLQEERDIEVQRLIKAKTHDESNVYRGAIQKLDKLLLAEKDADMASNQGQ